MTDYRQTGDPADLITVRVTFTVPISRAAWEMNYGVGGTNAIKADVRAYIENGTVDQLRQVGVLAEEED